jgi:hypothetical protein
VSYVHVRHGSRARIGFETIITALEAGGLLRILPNPRYPESVELFPMSTHTMRRGRY